MTTGYVFQACMSSSMLRNWDVPWTGGDRAPSMGLSPRLPIIALIANHNLSGHLSSVAQWGPQTRWSPQVYKFSCLNLIHNFVHILLFLRDNFSYIQKSEKANESQLLQLLSRFSHVQLCVTAYTAAHQAPPSLGFSRQEYWSGLPFPSLVHESEKWKWSCSVVPTPSDPMDCSLPGSYVHGIFQARVLEWVAIVLSMSHSPQPQILLVLIHYFIL